MTFANRLTLVRMGLAVAVFVALLTDVGTAMLRHIAAFTLFMAAIITDWIDGYIARKTNSISAFGKVADPIADKILVAGTLIALIKIKRLEIPPWGVFLIIARELAIGGVRILASAQGRLPIAEPWGKWKMGVQSTAIALILLILMLGDIPGAASVSDASESLNLPYYLTVLCVIVAWGSAYLYFRQSRQMLEKSWS